MEYVEDTDSFDDSILSYNNDEHGDENDTCASPSDVPSYSGDGSEDESQVPYILF